jgi:hypothetical protein
MDCDTHGTKADGRDAQALAERPGVHPVSPIVSGSQRCLDGAAFVHCSVGLGDILPR